MEERVIVTTEPPGSLFYELMDYLRAERERMKLPATIQNHKKNNPTGVVVQFENDSQSLRSNDEALV